MLENVRKTDAVEHWCEGLAIQLPLNQKYPRLPFHTLNNNHCANSLHSPSLSTRNTTNRFTANHLDLSIQPVQFPHLMQPTPLAFEVFHAKRPNVQTHPRNNEDQVQVVIHPPPSALIAETQYLVSTKTRSSNHSPKILPFLQPLPHLRTIHASLKWYPLLHTYPVQHPTLETPLNIKKVDRIQLHLNSAGKSLLKEAALTTLTTPLNLI
ncbi:hypothetical protein BCR33DRAFT_484459 [Rhizoclosmatium globosum]|uniref:Uncharacterized protein n=1 Tax=Rhizoclosmatium globosum TaxID=329046 RepID=A0A1Y2BN50_9FUNG|nr:hypothetical protein BCR33DRAFT_484459 [Rhizoclosmatium globosum]|eukprot:ORY36132.1 hypothetical protein BCR33DRAFT_484459 [Rhizoclosmatium globosum]